MTQHNSGGVVDDGPVRYVQLSASQFSQLCGADDGDSRRRRLCDSVRQLHAIGRQQLGADAAAAATALDVRVVVGSRPPSPLGHVVIAVDSEHDAHALQRRRFLVGYVYDSSASGFSGGAGGTTPRGAVRIYDLGVHDPAHVTDVTVFASNGGGGGDASFGAPADGARGADDRRRWHLSIPIMTLLRDPASFRTPAIAPTGAPFEGGSGASGGWAIADTSRPWRAPRHASDAGAPTLAPPPNMTPVEPKRARSDPTTVATRQQCFVFTAPAPATTRVALNTLQRWVTTRIVALRTRGAIDQPYAAISPDDGASAAECAAVTLLLIAAATAQPAPFVDTLLDLEHALLLTRTDSAAVAIEQRRHQQAFADACRTNAAALLPTLPPHVRALFEHARRELLFGGGGGGSSSSSINGSGGGDYNSNR